MLETPQKTLEILDDVVQVIDEYATYSFHTIGPYDFVDSTRVLVNCLPSGVGAVVAAQKKFKMLETILAGLKKLVLVHDCGVAASDLPDEVAAILALRGPWEVDDVVKYLSAALLSRAK